MAPEQNTPPADTGENLSTDDIYDALSSEESDDEKETLDLDSGAGDKKDKDIKEDSGTDDDDEREDEESEEEEETSDELDLKEEKEEDELEELELVTPFKRKEILKKYPNIFKEFPYLEKSYYREQKFTELYPTIDDAKRASEKAKTLDTFEGKLLSGNTEEILLAVKNTDKKAFNKVVDSYLPTLMKVDQAAFYHVVGNVLKDAVITMVSEGKKRDDKDLLGAAEKFHEFMFGTTEFTPKSQMSVEDERESEEQAKLNKQREDFTRERYEASREELDTRVTNAIKNTVNNNIDPKDLMSPYVKSKAIEDVIKEVNYQIRGDTRFMAIYDRLWEASFNDNFSKESRERLRNAWFSKARTILPAIITKSRNEALRGLGHSSKREDKDRKGPLPVGHSTSSSKRGQREVDKPKPGEKTLDYLMRD